MKTLTALTIALLILLPKSASALTITDGYVFVPNDSHRVSDFGGANFSVVAWQEWQGPVTSAFDVAPFTTTVHFSLSPATVLTVGSETCIPTSPFPFGPDPSCLGHITVTSPGLAMPTDWPTTTLFAASVPFSATGSLVVDGNQYDLTGEGTLTGLRCLDLAACGIQAGGVFPTGATLTYVFTVAEPATLLLPAVFALTIVGMAVVHRRDCRVASNG